jgi:VWFA-related protein
VPDGYVIVAYENSGACPHGAYVLKKDTVRSSASAAAAKTSTSQSASTAPQTAVSRPRRVGTAQVDPVAGPKLSFEGTPPNTPYLREPKLGGTPLGASVSSSPTDAATASGPEEVGDGDVVRIDTNFVAVPVSVLDRQGRFVPNLTRDDFKIFENGVEQKLANFENTESPFTVALLLDTSGSTVFHLWEIKEAAISFAKQLRSQDRVLVVTFNQDVLLLTEATNDLNVVTEVIEQNANTGFSTRLYDAISLVVNERLNKIKGRKAIVLFTDGVDTASYLASAQSTLREAEELDTLIYPVQYDTTDFLAATQARNSVTVTRTSNWPFGTSSSRVIYGPPVQVQGSTIQDYKLADQYLHKLAEKTGARLYKANDSSQLAQAFSRIAEELRCQYSLGYYPETQVAGGERRIIKVKVNQPDLAVRARDGYVQRGSQPKPTQ